MKIKKNIFYSSLSVCYANKEEFHGVNVNKAV